MNDIQKPVNRTTGRPGHPTQFAPIPLKDGMPPPLAPETTASFAPRADEAADDGEAEAGWYYDESGYQRDSDGVLTAAGRAKWITDDEAAEDDDEQAADEPDPVADAVDVEALYVINDQLTMHLHRHGWSAKTDEDDEALNNLVHAVAKKKADIAGAVAANRSEMNAIIDSFVAKNAVPG